MKTILCFGDSLTWGFDPVTLTRHAYHARWTGQLQKHLGNDYHVIEEGLNGRTTVFDDQFAPHRNGSLALPMLLESHAPLDLIIIMLGTNDIQTFRKMAAKDAARGCGTLLNIIFKANASHKGITPKILLLAPPIIIPNNTLIGATYQGAEGESQQFAFHYQRVADFYKIEFLDTAKFINASEADGVHLDSNANTILAEQIAIKVKQIFS